MATDETYADVGHLNETSRRQSKAHVDEESEAWIHSDAQRNGDDGENGLTIYVA
jgi:hypothetical protein